MSRKVFHFSSKLRPFEDFILKKAARHLIDLLDTFLEIYARHILDLRVWCGYFQWSWFN